MCARKKDRSTKVKRKAEGIIRANRLDAARAHPIAGRALLEQCRQLHEIIDPDVLQEEPHAQETRWVEYGYLDTFEATEAYTKAYVEVYPLLRREFIDSTPHECPIDPEFVRNDPGTMNALFRARQFADLMGVPYKFFIMGLCRALITEGGYKRVPLPNHLVPGKKDKALRHGFRVRDRILHHDRMYLFSDEVDPRFFAIHDRSDPVQVRARAQMIENVRGCITPQGRLRTFLRRGLLTVDQIESVFDQPMFSEVIAEAHAAGIVAPNEPATWPDFRPHCFGLHNVANPVCAKCTIAIKCEGMVEWVRREQIAVTGSANPRVERERAQVNQRKRNQRARDREKLAKTVGVAEKNAESKAGLEEGRLLEATPTGVVPTPDVPPTPLL